MSLSFSIENTARVRPPRSKLRRFAASARAACGLCATSRMTAGRPREPAPAAGGQDRGAQVGNSARRAGAQRTEGSDRGGGVAERDGAAQRRVGQRAAPAPGPPVPPLAALAVVSEVRTDREPF